MRLLRFFHAMEGCSNLVKNIRFGHILGFGLISNADPEYVNTSIFLKHHIVPADAGKFLTMCTAMTPSSNRVFSDCGCSPLQPEIPFLFMPCSTYRVIKCYQPENGIKKALRRLKTANNKFNLSPNCAEQSSKFGFSCFSCPVYQCTQTSNAHGK